MSTVYKKMFPLFKSINRALNIDVLNIRFCFYDYRALKNYAFYKSQIDFCDQFAKMIMIMILAFDHQHQINCGTHIFIAILLQLNSKAILVCSNPLGFII